MAKRNNVCNSSKKGQRKDRRVAHKVPKIGVCSPLQDVIENDAVFNHLAHQTSPLFSLPDEMCVTIFDLLLKSDIITMATTCRSIAEFVKTNFAPKLPKLFSLFLLKI